MKRIKLFIIAFISLLLPSCSNTPSSSLENNETEKLNHIVVDPISDNVTEPDDTKLPIGGKEPSGENSQNVRKSD